MQPHLQAVAGHRIPARRVAHQIYLHCVLAIGRQFRLVTVATGRADEQGFVLAWLADVEVIRWLIGLELDAEGLAGLASERVFGRGVALDLAFHAVRVLACRQFDGFLVDRIGAPGGRGENQGRQQQAGAEG